MRIKLILHLCFTMEIKSTRYNSYWDQINDFVYGDTIYSETNQAYQYNNDGYPTTMNVEGNSHYISLILKY